MIICDSHRFIFIHIHRTGGTSITELCHQHLADFKRPFFQHSHAGDQLPDWVPFSDYKTFAFVRNPWARIYSWYALLIKYNESWQRAFSFENFVIDHDDISKRYLVKGCFSFSQLHYLRNADGELVTDFIGRYESYQQDVAKMFDLLGIELTSIPHLNNTCSVDYREKYSSESKAVVEKLCADDIKFFDYQF